MTTKPDHYIARAAVGTMIVAVAMVSSTVVGGWWKLRATPAPSYAVGDKIDLPLETYSNAERTLVLFVRESCAVCQAEAPRLAELVERARSSSTPVASLVVTGSTRVEADREFAMVFKGSTHRHVSFDSLGVKTVPTVVLVDRHGTVVFAHEGRFKTPETMEELIRRISSR